MASGREIHLEDLPPELKHYEKDHASDNGLGWENLLENEVKQQLILDKADIAKTIIAKVESLLIKSALEHTSGKKNEAALMLGYGRNTLTRKVKELEIK